MPRKAKMFARSLRDREVRRGKLVILSLVSALAVAGVAFTATETWAQQQGNNGFGNGGSDGTNPGSANGDGELRHGPNPGRTQSYSKTADAR